MILLAPGARLCINAFGDFRMSTCPKCQGDMEDGFVLDVGYGTLLPSNWLEGDPDKNWLGNVKITGRRKFAITTRRCTLCGFLESYARP